MHSELKIGDVVLLNSGGQEMTVTDVADNDVTCRWFGRDGRLRKETFASICLKPQSGLNLEVLSQNTVIAIGGRQKK